MKYFENYIISFVAALLAKNKLRKVKGGTAPSNPQHSGENTRNVCRKQPTTPEQSCLDWQTTRTMTTPMPTAKTGNFRWERENFSFAFFHNFQDASRAEQILSLPTVCMCESGRAPGLIKTIVALM